MTALMNLADKEIRALAMLKAIELLDVFYSLHVKEYGETKKGYFKHLFNKTLTNKYIQLYSEPELYRLDTPYIEEIIYTAKELFKEFRKGNPYPFIEYSSGINKQYAAEIKESLVILLINLPTILTQVEIDKLITEYLTF